MTFQPIRKPSAKWQVRSNSPQEFPYLSLVFDVQKRIQQLRSYLDPNDPQYQPEPQHVNIKAVIELYERGRIDGHQQIHIRNGKIVTREESFKGPDWAWDEGLHYQYARFAYGHGPFGPDDHEVKSKASYFLNTVESRDKNLAL